MYMKSATLTLVLVLVGCVQLPEGEPVPVGVAEAALEEWQAQGLPTGACAAELELLRLEVGDAAELCNVERKYQPGGCYYDAHNLIVVEAALRGPDHDSALQHELRHWMSQCSGLGADPDHANAQIWYGGVLGF